MKIRLKAFEYLESKQYLDVPENTTPIFELALTQPIQVIVDWAGENSRKITPIKTMAKFEWNGMYEGDAKIYILTDIYKRFNN